MQLTDLKGKFRPTINDLAAFCCSCTLVGGVAPAHERNRGNSLQINDLRDWRRNASH